MHFVAFVSAAAKEQLLSFLGLNINFTIISFLFQLKMLSSARIKAHSL
jgi:hypothetical protein